MVERVPAVDEVGRRARVLVGQEAGLHRLHVGQALRRDLGPERLEHHGRHVDRDHPVDHRRHRDRGLSGPRAEVDDRR